MSGLAVNYKQKYAAIKQFLNNNTNCDEDALKVVVKRFEGEDAKTWVGTAKDFGGSDTPDKDLLEHLKKWYSNYTNDTWFEAQVNQTSWDKLTLMAMSDVVYAMMEDTTRKDVRQKLTAVQTYLGEKNVRHADELKQAVNNYLGAKTGLLGDWVPRRG